MVPIVTPTTMTTKPATSGGKNGRRADHPRERRLDDPAEQRHPEHEAEPAGLAAERGPEVGRGEDLGHR